MWLARSRWLEVHSVNCRHAKDAYGFVRRVIDSYGIPLVVFIRYVFFQNHTNNIGRRKKSHHMLVFFSSSPCLILNADSTVGHSWRSAQKKTFRESNSQRIIATRRRYLPALVILISTTTRTQSRRFTKSLLNQQSRLIYDWLFEILDSSEEKKNEMRRLLSPGELCWTASV